MPDDEMIMWWAREPKSCGATADIRVSSVCLPGIKCESCGRVWMEYSRIYEDPPRELVAKLVKLKGPQTNAVHKELTVAAVALGYPPLFPGAGIGTATVTAMRRKSPRVVLWHGGRMFIDANEAELAVKEANGRFQFKRCEGRFELAELATLSIKPSSSQILCSACGFIEDPADPLTDLVDMVKNSLGNNWCVLTPGRRWFSNEAKTFIEKRNWENIEFCPPELPLPH